MKINQCKERRQSGLSVQMGSHGCCLHRAQRPIGLAENQKLNILLLLGRKVNNGLFVCNHNRDFGRGVAYLSRWNTAWASVVMSLLAGLQETFPVIAIYTLLILVSPRG